MDVDEQVIIPIKKYNKMLNAYNKFNDELIKYEKEIESQYRSRYISSYSELQLEYNNLRKQCDILMQDKLRLTNEVMELSNKINKMNNSSLWRRFINFISSLNK